METGFAPILNDILSGSHVEQLLHRSTNSHSNKLDLQRENMGCTKLAVHKAYGPSNILLSKEKQPEIEDCRFFGVPGVAELQRAEQLCQR